MEYFISRYLVLTVTIYGATQHKIGRMVHPILEVIIICSNRFLSIVVVKLQRTFHVCHDHLLKLGGTIRILHVGAREI